LILLSQSYISKFARAGQFEEKEALLTCFFWGVRKSWRGKKTLRSPGKIY
jgi:hypothetical protein